MESGIQDRPYGGLFRPSDQSGVSPQLMINDILDWVFGGGGGGGGRGSFETFVRAIANVIDNIGCLATHGRLCD